MSRHIHVGPYLRITVKKATQTKTRKECPAHKDHLTQFDFCPDCGTKIEEVEYEHEYFPCLYDLLEEASRGEDFFLASQRKSLIVALPNHAHEWVVSEDDGHGGWSTDMTDPGLAEVSIANMKAKYGETIIALSKLDVVRSISPCFGVVTYWM